MVVTTRHGSREAHTRSMAFAYTTERGAADKCKQENTNLADGALVEEMEMRGWKRAATREVGVDDAYQD